jgi:hypothetical protein
MGCAPLRLRHRYGVPSLNTALPQLLERHAAALVGDSGEAKGDAKGNGESSAGRANADETTTAAASAAAAAGTDAAGKSANAGDEGTGPNAAPASPESVAADAFAEAPLRRAAACLARRRLAGSPPPGHTAAAAAGEQPPSFGDAAEAEGVAGRCPVRPRSERAHFVEEDLFFDWLCDAVRAARVLLFFGGGA